LQRLRQQVAGSKVLIVEDNMINQKVTKKMLEKTGCIVDTALDGMEAIEKVTSEKYDLIFMDIMMPNLSGVEATIKIRTLLKNKDYINIIAMTAHAMKGDRERYIDAGMDDYLSKPFSQEKLYRMLQKWLVVKKEMVQS
jgi:CheY-like chemotaxis protein